MAAASYSTPEIKNVHFDNFVTTLPSMAGKLVAITGCTSGTGFITAKTVAAAGASVIMLNRMSERAAAAEQQIRDAVPGAEVFTIPCDLQSIASVSEAARFFSERFPEGGLDVLVCNGGVMALPDQPSGDGFDVQMHTNHLSHFQLVRDFMFELEKAAEIKGEARVVHATSNARKIPFQDDPAGTLKEEFFGQNGGNLGGDDGKWTRYGQSKMANCVFHYALHDKLQAKGSRVRTLLTHPGLAATNLQVSTAGADESGGAGGMLQKMMEGAQSGEDGTMPMLSGVCLPDAASGDFFGPKDAGCIGPGTKGEAIKLTPEEQLTAPEAKASLWEWSNKAVGEFPL